MKNYRLTIDTTALTCMNGGHPSTTSVPIVEIFLDPLAVHFQDVRKGIENVVRRQNCSEGLLRYTEPAPGEF